MRSKIKIFFIIFCVFSPIIVSTTQLVPPYNQYEVSGVLKSSISQKTISNVTVVLFGKFKTSSEWIDLRNFTSNDNDKQDYPIAITDSVGNFFIRITPQFDKLDSIAPAIMIQNKGVELGQAVSLFDNSGTIIKKRYTYSNESGCSCENTTSSELVTAGYVYSVKDLILLTNKF